jgi:hypothetical protein
MTLLFLAACAGAPAAPACDPAADGDADGVPDCDELAVGLDPDSPDSDGDGYDDRVELDCVSDGLDPNEVCYECGWPHGDPGTLVATGDDVGDVPENLGFVDQCGEDVALWDFHGEYHILFMTAAW